jgi:hypothetical protein
MRFILRLLIALIVIVLALGALVKIREVSLRHKLTGTWVADFPDGNRSTWSMEPDGSYSGQLTWTNGTVINLEGTTRVKFGFMHTPAGHPRLGFLIVETVTKTSETNATVPYSRREYIANLTDQDLVINVEYSMWDSSAFRKVMQ